MNSNDTEFPDTRLRSSAMAVTTKTKQRLSTEFGGISNITNDQGKEKFISNIEERFMLSTKGNTENSNFIEFPTPSFKGVATNKGNKIKFSENATLVDLGVKYETIESKPTTVEFKSLLNKYEESKIDDFEIQDLLNFDFESIASTREKLNDLIDKTSLLVNCNVENNPDENNRRSQMLIFLCNKLNELKNSERQVKVMINNIEKVKEVSFLGDKISVKFD